LILNKDPSESLFHPNDIIIVSDQTVNNQHYKTKRTKKVIEKKKNYSQTIGDFSTQVCD
jgi:hypothetical protein